tara:strand:- start:3685 stop:4344 length:660 start_codon:yes stop_codon:yes gene_type:complete
MAGNKSSKDKLNLSLIKIIKIFNKYHFNQWFIAYGTLLGVVRDNSCIENDDDIDIICDINDYEKLKALLLKENYELDFGYGINDSKNILKTKESINSCSIDFYMTEVDKNGNFNDLWEKVIWTKCYQKNSNDFIKLNWNNVLLNLPADYYKKIRKRYGLFWRIPQKNKGNRTHKQSKLIRLSLRIHRKMPIGIQNYLKSFIKSKNFLYKFVKPKDSTQV